MTCPRLAPLPDDGVLVGWSRDHDHDRPPEGFCIGSEAGGDSAAPTLAPILFAGEGHLMTIAPPGADTPGAAIIPDLLCHSGSTVVVDPGGEAAAATAGRRRGMGQQVAVIDPFGVFGDSRPATFNPFDLIDMWVPDGPEDCAALAAQVIPIPHQGAPVWDLMARHLVAALTAHVTAEAPKDLRNPAEIHYVISQGDKDLDGTAKEMSRSSVPFVRAGAGLLEMTEPKARASILATARAHLSVFGLPRVQASTAITENIDPMALVDDRPVTVYLVLPPETLETHAALVRVWLGSLIRLILRRRRPATRPTLVLINGAGQLGPWDDLRRVVTLPRSQGLQTWSFWQDLSQIQTLYPSDWRTMVNACRAIQAFGTNTLDAARSVCAATGFADPDRVLGLASHEMLLTLAGTTPVIARRPNALTDPPLAGLAESLPSQAPGVRATADGARSEATP